MSKFLGIVVGLALGGATFGLTAPSGLMIAEEIRWQLFGAMLANPTTQTTQATSQYYPDTAYNSGFAASCRAVPVEPNK